MSRVSRAPDRPNPAPGTRRRPFGAVLLCHLPPSATERLVQADSGLLLQPREPELCKARHRVRCAGCGASHCCPAWRRQGGRSTGCMRGYRERELTGIITLKSGGNEPAPPASGHSALCNTWPIRLSNRDRLRSNEACHAEPVAQRARHVHVIKTRAQFRGDSLLSCGLPKRTHHRRRPAIAADYRGSNPSGRHLVTRKVDSGRYPTPAASS
jgi:hypothetical protein